MAREKGTIGILTGGGDVPGLNPAIRAVTIRALREGYKVIGIRRGWAGLTDLVPDKDADNSANYHELTEEVVNRAGRTGGTFIHSSRTRPSHLPKAMVPPHLADLYTDEINDITPTIKKNIEWLGLDYLIPIGGDDTLSYGHRLHQDGIKIVGIPKTMDNDVPGTDYCIGFGTCVTRTIEMAHTLRTSAGSHERFLVIEVFGRYAGFTALLPTMAGAADRCVIPEHPFDAEHLTEILSYDRNLHPSKYAVVLVSEGATMAHNDTMSFKGDEADQYGHKKLGGIGDKVAAELKRYSPKYNNGRRVNVVSQRLGYLVRCGDPDALDSIVPMAFGNLALDLILNGTSGRLVSVRNGTYDNVPLDVVVGTKKVVDVDKYYNAVRFRPFYHSFNRRPTFIMTSDI
ncbi:MAG: ATP-dependent 6-phosphofructokinase [Bacteroidetes Order II. Incertae sedis bacterium]|jgi:ATP-dependent phosphofructokinase / diphosphate-dependent phosphofructokinase|nr:ATP-dependent 6-phosphofructokinase [Bacteroidetes Order II. bacterium]MDG1754616.1 ATP-dependent 6-phosphofructokinase [Rhodothermales bacterium]MBT4051608.1 ATP-dependent 6-phosphofructokinase [Bacteroidetes Order II. bacterium]MBT4602243.1 ATP-dependent 6-phosphofructokinase [Bacteroidetes Order II. bacterium]MBT5249470.1 ATP-dependent 6-phosphofructokinase [Bacteroidetes Order II. bacterium]